MMACEDEKPDGSHIRLPVDGFTGKYRDDLTSQILCDRLVHEASVAQGAIVLQPKRGMGALAPRRSA